MNKGAPPNAGKLLERGAFELERAGVTRSKWEAELLLRHALGWSREFLLAHPHEAVKALELENMVEVAELYFKASMLRTETRYSHRNIDHPLRDNENWLKFINWQKGKNGNPIRSFEAVPPIRS